jgi:riboflavin kinase/FMN adenylyltransferase
MEVYRSLDALPGGFGPSAVTIGKFDGVHLGHERMIAHLRESAEREDLVPVVLTFDRNPLSVLAPEACPLSLVSNAQKLELLERGGVAATVMLEFDRSFSEHPAEEFAHEVLARRLGARLVLVGADFRFGKGGKGDVAALERYGREAGFEVELLAPVEVDGRRVSSTWARELLAAGEVRAAARVLGRRPSLRGVVVEGAHRGRELGFPTANLAPDLEGFVPADGVYAAWALIDGVRRPAAVSIGNNPTFEGVPERQVEAHVLGPGSESIDLDLYGRTIELEFVDRVRGMIRFDDVEALTAGIAADLDVVRDRLAADSEAQQ